MRKEVIGDCTVYLGDCLEVMKRIPTESVDMILCDLPYGTTDCAWDAIIPFESLWCEYWRVAKRNAAIVLTASQPFTANLIKSDVNFRYNWYWVKNRKTGQMNAKKQPLRCVEEICVFNREQPTYNPQFGNKTKHGGTKTPKSNSSVTNSKQRSEYIRPEFETPNHVLYFDTERGLHPTQKPVDLFEYLIKTYTNEGETVLDNCSGSGTTAIAAMRSGRRSICIERDEVYFEKSLERIKKESTTMKQGEMI